MKNPLSFISSYTFQEQQRSTDKIWKFQRYFLVVESFDAPILPPPLNILGYILNKIINLLREKNSKDSSLVEISNSLKFYYLVYIYDKFNDFSATTSFL